MEPPAGPFFPARHGSQRYVCYCGAEPGAAFNAYVTNASEVWSTDFNQEKLERHMAQSGISEDYSTKFREAFEHRTAALTVHNGRATLELKEDAWSLTFDLFKLPSSEARMRLQALMFGLMGCVSSLEKRLEAAEGAAAAAAAVCRSEKNQPRSQKLLMPDLSPRKNQGGGSAVLAKRRVPGESLINPGFKSKKAPTGVDYEDS
ncbi:protein PAXX isoform X2 [Alligator mississippiensis]|uniref:Protein PAXX n=1 Tax=Alligator mississippiensis TaxID=8496 RepID=A0A151MF11_ALLMI|nr:protein PAXX isoform X2 [Alligator mississippiensis]KYO23114.1 protein PAXX [Alligator mississippiensis]